MSDSQQSFQNHARIDPLFHRFLVPILLIHMLWTGWRMIQYFSADSVEALVLAIALVIMGFYVRVNALRAQDRVIRLEEQLRCERLGIGGKEAGLTVPQIVALRFASDAELPGLVDQVASGKLAAPKDIKAAIKTWRPDHVRV